MRDSGQLQLAMYIRPARERKGAKDERKKEKIRQSSSDKNHVEDAMTGETCLPLQQLEGCEHDPYS